MKINLCTENDDTQQNRVRMIKSEFHSSSLLYVSVCMNVQMYMCCKCTPKDHSEYSGYWLHRCCIVIHNIIAASHYHYYSVSFFLCSLLTEAMAMTLKWFFLNTFLPFTLLFINSETNTCGNISPHLIILLHLLLTSVDELGNCFCVSEGLDVSAFADCHAVVILGNCHCLVTDDFLTTTLSLPSN